MKSSLKTVSRYGPNVSQSKSIHHHLVDPSETGNNKWMFLPSETDSTTQSENPEPQICHHGGEAYIRNACHDLNGSNIEQI